MALRRPGLRTYRRACSLIQGPLRAAANDLSRIFAGIGALDGALTTKSRFDARLSDILRRGHHRYPLSAGCYGRSSEAFPPTSIPKANGRWSLIRLYRKFSTTVMQRLVRTKKLVGTSAVDAPASYDLHSSA
jgi:hypothetical protein